MIYPDADRFPLDVEQFISNALKKKYPTHKFVPPLPTKRPHR